MREAGGREAEVTENNNNHNDTKELLFYLAYNAYRLVYNNTTKITNN
jgi:hypothetical protein